jgi:RNA polymerase sigma-70 factor, ECF subfamily
MNIIPIPKRQDPCVPDDDRSKVDPEPFWIQESQKGNSNAFNHLVLRWEKPIYNLTLRMLRRPEEAAETTQEIFLSAFRSIRSFNGKARFSTWLFRIAINRCLTQLARRPADKHYSLDEELPSGQRISQQLVTGSFEGEILRREDGRRAVRAMHGLPPEQRVVLELKFFQELTFPEIAEVLAMPESSVKTRLYTGLQSLQERLRQP